MECNRDIKVLLVDNESMSQYIVGLMEVLFEVVPVRHPYHALETLRTMGGFDLVISDVDTPDMNGFQLQQLIAHEFQLPVVVMCDEKQEVIFGLGMQKGTLSIIRKPVSTNDLIHLWRFITAHIGNLAATPKSNLEWTFELHSKFMDVVNHLGGIKKAKPIRILSLMSVRGLTRENVSSHLQKIRLLYLGPERMNKNATNHRQYLLTSSGGARLIPDDWSHFLRVCNYRLHHSSSVAENENQLQVEGSSNLSPEIHDLQIGENFGFGSILNIVGQDNWGDHHMVDPTNNTNYPINPQIGNENGMDYYSEREQRYVEHPHYWIGQPSLQQQVNGDISIGSQQAQTFQENINQQYYSSPTQRDNDNNFDVNSWFASSPHGGAGNGDC